MLCSVGFTLTIVFTLTLTLAVVPATSISLDTKEAVKPQLNNDQNGKCEEITVPMCRNMEYNMTSMPNQFNHETQAEAAMEVLYDNNYKSDFFQTKLKTSN